MALGVKEMPQLPAATSLSYVAVVAAHHVAITEATGNGWQEVGRLNLKDSGRR